MNRKIRIFLVVVISIVALAFIGVCSVSESLPVAQQESDADALARRMLKALNHDAYDSTRYLEWTFKGVHSFLWDKEAHRIVVKWDANEVVIFPNETDKSEVIRCGSDDCEGQKEELISTATKYFNNDSFWLVAPYKVFDAGVERSVVKHKGKDALMVTYTNGGDTPGDSYLWILDDDYMPTHYKMWVSIIPVKGLKASWERWVVTESGAMLPTNHKILHKNLSMGNVKAYN